MCFFFFKDDNVDQKNATNALCALLHQLFSWKRALLKHAIPDFVEDGDMLPRLFSKLWNILSKAARDPQAGEIICVLDALDECEEQGRFKLIDTLTKFYRHPAKNDVTLKFLVTSRPYYDVERRFIKLMKNQPNIRLAGEGEVETESISLEINLVIKSRVEDIGSELELEESERLFLKEELLKVRQRTYLWVELIFDVIRSSLNVTEKGLRLIISTIPDTVDEAYEAILNKSPDIERARKLLHIVVSAVRPLTLTEMNVALEIEEGCTSLENLDLEPEGRFGKKVRNLCGLFVNIVDSKIYLIHQTAKQFLVSERTTQPAGYTSSCPEFWKHSLKPGESNLILGKICILYLLFMVLESHYLAITLGADGEIDQYINRHIFLDYSAKNWTVHFRKSEVNRESELIKSILKCVTPKDNLDLAGRLSNLSTMLASQYQRTGNIDSLAMAIPIVELAVSATPVGHSNMAQLLNNFGNMLQKRFERIGRVEDLEGAIQRTEQAVALTPSDQSDRAGRLNDLGNMLQKRFMRTGRVEDLEDAIQRAKQAVAVMPEDHLSLAVIFNSLGSMLLSRFERVGSMEDLEEAIEKVELAVELTPSDHPDMAGRLNNFGNVLQRRFERIGRMEDLEEAIQRAKQAVAATPKNHPDQAGRLDGLGNKLQRRFERTGNIDNLEEAIQRTEQAVILTSSDHPDQAGMLDNLGSRLGTRFKRTGTMEDLNHAVDVADMAIDATPYDHPDRAGRLSNLGNWLGKRFEWTSSMDDLNRAVDVVDMAVVSTPQDHPDQAGRLNNLGNLLGRRFERTGSVDDLNRAVNTADMTVMSTPQDHPDRAGRLNNLGNWLGRQFEQTGSMDDLNRAIDVANIAVDATPQDHPDQATYLNNLGNLFGRRFKRIGSMDDLNRAVDIANIAVDATPQDHPDRAAYLNNLGNLFGRRFKRTGSMDDLNCAINVADMAVEATPQDHPDRAAYLNNLGNMLGRRFERTGSMDDLNRAVDIADMAVMSTPQDHPDRVGQLNNLGNLLGRRFERTGSMDDLNRAVDVANIAVDSTPQDHPDRAAYLNNIGNWLGRRFERTGFMDDLHHAVDIANIAVDTTPQDHPDRAAYLNNLGNLLGKQFERTGSMANLNHAINITDMAVMSIPQDHPDLAAYLDNLGNLLSMRFEQTSSMDDLNYALSSYKKGWSCHCASTFIRIRLAQKAASILASQLNWQESYSLLREAVNLLPVLSPRSLKHTDKQHMLAEFAGLASMAAATALNARKDAYHALRLLELGRGVIAGLLMEMRGDISDLKQRHPSLADEFTSFRDKLDVPVDKTTSPISTNNTSSWESQVRRHREVDQKFSELITRIRAQSGFNNFLLPPTAVELMTAADPDPIIIVNLSSYRCDAFLIERDQIRVLELPSLTLTEVQKQARDLQSSRQAAFFHVTPILEWLWDAICRPSLEALGFKNPISDISWPRVWWISAGLLSQLPLHAAGRYTLGSTETVLDRVMSSYASSVKALIYGRRHHIREPARSTSYRALLVAMHKTPGLFINKILPFAVDEVNILKDLCPELQLEPIAPTPRKDNILQHLQACKIFHFAGHMRSDQVEPSQSCLVLEDWETNPLTVGDLRDHRLQDNPPFLGYLSACSTGANEVDRLADEGIHLVSAFQLAGFRHVIGTLWEVSDMHCVDVARVLYKTILDEGMTDMAVCRGLHRAIRALRDSLMEKRPEGRNTTSLHFGTQARGLTNHYWIPYVHFGI
jgi:tetratricopeptide (TPR) repeat protein